MEWISQWVVNYGYLALFGLLMVGIFGVPVPDELLLSLTGYLVWKGDMHAFIAWPVAACGSSCGITVSYIVGRTIGTPVILRYGKYVHVTPERLDKVHQWYEHLGKWALTFGYYVPGVRHVTAIVAGTSGMPWHHFGLFAYAGAAIWTATFIAIGYGLGQRWKEAWHVVERHMNLGAIIAAAVVVIVFLVRWWWQKRKQAKAQ